MFQSCLGVHSSVSTRASYFTLKGTSRRGVSSCELVWCTPGSVYIQKPPLNCIRGTDENIVERGGSRTRAAPYGLRLAGADETSSMSMSTCRGVFRSYFIRSSERPVPQRERQTRDGGGKQHNENKCEMTRSHGDDILDEPHTIRQLCKSPTSEPCPHGDAPAPAAAPEPHGTQIDGKRHSS